MQPNCIHQAHVSVCPPRGSAGSKVKKTSQEGLGWVLYRSLGFHTNSRPAAKEGRVMILPVPLHGSHDKSLVAWEYSCHREPGARLVLASCWVFLRHRLLSQEKAGKRSPRLLTLTTPSLSASSGIILLAVFCIPTGSRTSLRFPTEPVFCFYNVPGFIRGLSEEDA